MSKDNEDKGMNKQQGFSLIEILVVLVIMGLLVSIIAPNVLGRADEARVQKVFADFSAIETALRMYRLDNYGLPSSEQGLRALVERPTLAPVPANWKADGYLESLPIDPWGNPYLYLSPGTQGDYDIFTYGADGARGGEGQNADLGNWQSNENRN
jgi:general secretion pathway protein G